MKKGTEMETKKDYLLSGTIVAVAIAAMMLFVQCTPAQVQTGINVADALLQVIGSILKPSLDMTREACEQREKTLVKSGEVETVRQLRADCASLNDAWMAVQEAETKAKAAYQTGDKTEIDTAVLGLEKAVEELQSVIASTWAATLDQ